MKRSKGLLVFSILVAYVILPFIPLGFIFPEVQAAWMEDYGWEVVEIQDEGSSILNAVAPPYSQSCWYGEEHLWVLWIDYNSSLGSDNPYQLTSSSSGDDGETWTYPQESNLGLRMPETYGWATCNDLSYIYVRYVTKSGTQTRAMTARGEYRDTEEDIAWDGDDRSGSFTNGYYGYWPALEVDNTTRKFDGSEVIASGNAYAWARKGDAAGSLWSNTVASYDSYGEHNLESLVTHTRVVPVIQNRSHSPSDPSNRMYYVWSSQDKSLQGKLLYNEDTTWEASEWSTVASDGEFSDYEPTEEYAFASCSNFLTGMAYVAYVRQTTEDIRLATRYPNGTFTEILVSSALSDYVQPYVSVSSFPVTNATDAKDDVFVVWKTHVGGNYSIWMSVVEYSTKHPEGEASTPFILYSSLYEIGYFNMYRYSYKESRDDYDNIRFIIAFGEDDDDSERFDINAIVFDPKVLPPIEEEHNIIIDNMEGCGNWVFAGNEKYYNFVGTFNFTDGTYPDLLAVTFSDGYHDIEFSYNVTLGEYSLDSGSEYVVLQGGSYALSTNASGYDLYTCSFQILFFETIYDALNVDLYYKQVDTDGNGDEWLVSSLNYFNIYCQGDINGVTLSGSGGQIPGGQQWEVYAGGQYFKADIFEEYWESGVISAARWQVNEYSEEGALNDIDIDDWQYHPDSPYNTDPYFDDDHFSVHIIDGYSGSLAPSIETLYNPGSVLANYSVQVYAYAFDNTTGYSSIRLRGVYYGVDVTIAVLRLGFTSDFDGVYYDNASSAVYGGYNYDVTEWHNLTIQVVNTENIMSSYCTFYFDGNIMGSEYFLAMYRPNRLDIRSDYGTAIRRTHFDSIKIWSEFGGGSQGSAKAYTYFRNLQHVHLELGFGTNDEGIWSYQDEDSNDHQGYIEVGMDVCSRQDTTDWYEQWKVRIQIADGRCSPSQVYAYLNISWYERENYVKSDFLFAYYEGFRGNKDYFTMYVDLWFPLTNSSSAIAGRVNSKVFGVSDQAPLWLSILTLGLYQSWGDMRTDDTYSRFEYPLYNTTGSIHPCREIYIMRPWVKVYRTSNFGFQYYVWNQGLEFNHLAANARMTGINDPPLIETISVANEFPGFWRNLLGVFQTVLGPLFQALNVDALGFWNTAIGFLDTVFSFTGNPNAFSDFMAFLSSGWVWFASGIAWITTFLTDMFMLFAVTLTTGFDVFGILVTSWIDIIQTTTSILGDGLQTGYDLWNDFQMYAWLELCSIMYVAWLVLYGMNEGWDKVATHLTFVFNLLMFVFNIILGLLNFVLRLMTSIIESIPVVE